MLGLIRTSDNAFVAAVESTDGYDLTGYTVVEMPAGDPAQLAWDGTQFVQRPATADEQARAAVAAEELWAQLESATPQQVESWLANNVTSLASARRVLKFILLALKSMRHRL